MRFANLISTREELSGEQVDIFVEEAATEASNDTPLVESSANDIAVISGGLEQADNGIELIEGAQEALSGGNEMQPATDLEVVTVESLLTSIHTSLGTESTVRSTLESYGRVSRSRLVATLEAEKDGFITKIINGIKAMISAVVGFFKNLFQSKAGLAKYIEALTKQADKMSGKETGTGKIDAKFPDAQAVIQALEGSRKIIAVGNKAIEINEKAVKEFEKSMADGAAATLDDAMDTGESILELSNYVFSEGRTFDMKEGVMKGNPSFPKQGETLSMNDCKRILKDLSSTMKEFDGMKKTESKITDLGKTIMDFVSKSYHKLTSRFRSDEGKMESALTTARREMMASYRKSAQLYGGKLPMEVFRTIKAGADYVKDSLATAKDGASRDGGKKGSDDTPSKDGPSGSGEAADVQKQSKDVNSSVSNLKKDLEKTDETISDADAGVKKARDEVEKMELKSREKYLLAVKNLREYQDKVDAKDDLEKIRNEPFTGPDVDKAIKLTEETIQDQEEKIKGFKDSIDKAESAKNYDKALNDTEQMLTLNRFLKKNKALLESLEKEKKAQKNDQKNQEDEEQKAFENYQKELKRVEESGREFSENAKKKFPFSIDGIEKRPINYDRKARDEAISNRLKAARTTLNMQKDRQIEYKAELDEALKNKDYSKALTLKKRLYEIDVFIELWKVTEKRINEENSGGFDYIS